MSDDNVVEFKPKNTDNDDIYFGNASTHIVGFPLDSISSPKEYLALCKKELEREDYHDVLCGIVDIDIYYELDKDLQRIVETYYTYTGTDLTR